MSTSNVINVKYIRRHERVLKTPPSSFTTLIKQQPTQRFSVVDFSEMEGSGGGLTFIYNYDPEAKTVIGTTIDDERDAYEFTELYAEDPEEAELFALLRNWTHFMVVDGYDVSGEPIIKVLNFKEYVKHLIDSYEG